ncbi:D-alanyl-lipoteichoic acid biosynthesis protein DltD [Ligilactobacillus salivarius]|nr:D-alanyl-lipoteichoic acid biosynthesis protein DltD [Ligilactobacillus salivarius]
MKKKLFLIFGPLVLAAVLLAVVLVTPFNFTKPDSEEIHEASLSQSNNIFKGTAVKKAAFEQNYVPFMGSSELSRIDAFHPASMALRYHRDYQPFLLGAAGSQSLTQFWGMQGVNNELKNKKVVFIISPQWFVKQGINPAAFSMYYSNLEAVTWLRQANNSKMDRYAAQRLLKIQKNHSDSFLKDCIEQIANGKKLSATQKTYLDLKYNQLAHEDQFFSTLSLKNRVKKIKKASKKLPAKEDNAELESLATKLGEKATTNNDFGISNKFWNRELKDKYKRLKGEQSNFDYVSSPEFGDFQLVLNQFAENNNDVLFIIPPVNEKWSSYTGLSKSMLRQFDKKVTYQLREQGFNNILDLSNDGGKPYFMQDTIHLGWHGWLTVDKSVKPFLDGKDKVNKNNNYKINNYFYSDQWQKAEGQELNNIIK